MNNILITGASGFVGSNLSCHLADKSQFNLFALDIQKNMSPKYKEAYIWTDIMNIAFNEISTIIHLAGKAHDTKNTSNKDDYYTINVGLTKLIFDQFLKSDTKKFIFFSSVKAVADSVVSENLTEDDIPKPESPYGISKLEAEKYILSKKLPAGKQVYILRPAMIHGPGNKGNLNLLYKLIKTGIPYPLGAFSNKRSYTSINNLNFIIEKLILNDIEPGIYQIADSESLSTIEVIQLIAQSIGKKPRIWSMPINFVKFVAKIGDLLSLTFNSEKLKKLTENYVVSNKKIISALQCSLPDSATAGIKLTLTSFKQK